MLLLALPSSTGWTATPVVARQHASLYGTPVTLAHAYVMLSTASSFQAGLRAVRMQQIEVGDEAASFYDEYKRSDAGTGQSQPISFAEKEKLYLECLDAFYNEGGKQLLPDDEYEALKNDLNFEGRCAFNSMISE